MPAEDLSKENYLERKNLSEAPVIHVPPQISLYQEKDSKLQDILHATFSRSEFKVDIVVCPQLNSITSNVCSN